MAPRGQGLLTFATKNDWFPVLSALEEKLEIKYVESGMFPHPTPKQYESFRELPKFGEAIWGEDAAEARYLIMKKNTPVSSRSVRLNTGETCYVTDHENNPESIIFSPGGILKTQNAVIRGEVSKLSTLAPAEEIFRTFSKLVKNHFPAIRAARVGSEARTLGNEGYRLTASVRSPVDYDLSIADF